MLLRNHFTRSANIDAKPSLPANGWQHIFERRIAYIFSVVFTRCSVLAYYLRIFPPSLRSLRTISWILLALVVALFVETLTVLLVHYR